MRNDPYRSGFSFTAGILTAVGIFLALLAVCYFAWEEYKIERARQLLRDVRQAVDRDVDRPGAIRAAGQILAKVGYGEPEADTEVALADEPATHWVSGTCKRQGRSHKFDLYFTREAKRWRVVSLSIDGREL